MQLSAGEKLGPYELLTPIGQGGMGEVWKAHDPRLNRDVAIKVSSAQFSDRFEREARAIAALNHPNICQIYDVGPNYLVMEYIEGTTLQGPLPLDQALRYAVQICDALEAAHKKNITHRDLKPLNILVTASGVKLLDFGLAKIGTISAPASDSETQITGVTTAGTILGTAAYMSPEQAKGEPVDARSDIFSFGLVLYEMLSGRPAFLRNSAGETTAAILRDDPPPLEAPPTVCAIVARCLRKSPGERYQKITEGRAALDDAAGIGGEKSPSIAVLPFANMSRDADDEYFSDGLAEDIIHLLARVPNLKVTARTSAFAFRGKEQDITKIAQALHVSTILEGSVRRSHNRIRVTAQLVNAEDGFNLWSERYDRELMDVFAIQDEIAEAITSALQLTLIPKSTKHAPTLPAYEALLRARHQMRSYSPEGFTTAEEYCRQAIALDPQYAVPHALLGFQIFFAATHTGRIKEVAPLIRKEAIRSLELDPSETDPHILLGALASVLDYNWPEAARQFQLALASPSPPAEAHWAYAALYLGVLGRFEESSAELRRAVERDPLNVNWRGILVAHLVNAGRYEEALHEGQKALDITQTETHPFLGIGEAYLALGRVAEAAASAEKAHRNFPQHSMPTGLLAACLVRLGEKQQAEALVQEMGDIPNPLWGRAWFHLLCSEIDEGASWYEKMIETRDVFAGIYANSPYTRELRSSPHWSKLARRMNLPQS